MAYTGRGLGLIVVVMLGGLACGDDGGGQAWEPPIASGTSQDSGSGSALDTGDTEAGMCMPGSTQSCLCPDGLSLGEQTCEEDGVSFSACACDTDDTGDEGSTGDPMPPLPDEVCFLGADRAGTTCLPLVAFYADLPMGYEYPPAMQDNGQDRPPLALIDVQEASGSLALAPNFVLDELAQPEIGQWAVIQPHAVVALQAMREAAGPIGVVTGYLSPQANMAQGGELYARHQYGDGFDLEPLDISVGALANICMAQGGAVVEFETHLHCEFSASALDESFFGPPPAALGPGSTDAPMLDAWIEPDDHGYWAPALGFSEGEPVRRWTARDVSGRTLSEGEGRRFEPPPGTAEVEVFVGGRVLRAIDVAEPTCQRGDPRCR